MFMKMWSNHLDTVASICTVYSMGMLGIVNTQLNVYLYRLLFSYMYNLPSHVCSW